MAQSLADLKKEVQQLIGRARTKQAVSLIENYVNSQATWAQVDFFTLKAKHEEFNRDKLLGTLSAREESTAFSQIIRALLDFMNYLEAGPAEVIADPPVGGTTVVSGSISTILFLSANPADTGPLQLAKEHREIKRGLETTLARDLFALETETAARSSDMRDAIRRKKPRFVHFSGHGISAKELEGAEVAGTRSLSWAKKARPSVTEHGVSGLGIALNDRNGNTHLVKNDILAKMFELAKEDVECVIFNNCYSQGQAEAVKTHIPFVIGMNRAVPDETAIAFAVGAICSAAAYERNQHFHAEDLSGLGYTRTVNHMLMN